MSSLKEKFKEMLKKKKKTAEGFGPIYKDGKIVPGYEGLGPKYEKELKMKVMPRDKYRELKRIDKKDKQPRIKNIRNLA